MVINGQTLRCPVCEEGIRLHPWHEPEGTMEEAGWVACEICNNIAPKEDYVIFNTR